MQNIRSKKGLAQTPDSKMSSSHLYNNKPESDEAAGTIQAWRKWHHQASVHLRICFLALQQPAVPVNAIGSEAVVCMLLQEIQETDDVLILFLKKRLGNFNKIV